MHVNCAINDGVLSNADNRPEVPMMNTMSVYLSTLDTNSLMKSVSSWYVSPT